MPKRAGGLARTGLGLAVSIVSIALVVRGVDLGRTAQILAAAQPSWLLAALAFQSLDVVLRATRWQRLLAPIRSVRLRPMLGYLLIGYLANNILPARLGELVRSHYVGDREGISRAAALGTVVVERIIDTVVVVAIGAVAILVLHVRGIVANAVLLGLAMSALLVLGLALGLVAHRLPGADRALAMVERRPLLARLGRRLHEGLGVVRRPRTLVEGIGLSLAAWTAAVLALAASGQALGLQLTVGEASLLAAGIALATAIPSGPGYLGTFELAAVKIGETIGIPADRALALAVLAHASILLLTSVGGAVAFVRLGWRRSATEVGAVREAGWVGEIAPNAEDPRAGRGSSGVGRSL